MPGEELERLRVELQDARAALGDFTYAVSHDLRASLRHILSYATLLREEAGPLLTGEPATYLETIQGSARTLAQQIDGLMAWSQLDRAELQFMELDTAALIAEAQAQAQLQLGEASAGRHVVWRVLGDLPRLHGDAALLRQLFVHLLSNALKFTRPRETAVIGIGVDVAPTGWVTFQVRDNGVGFDPARQAKLFHVFHRLHGATQFEGLGLGLALARKIVERHGGSIKADGLPDAGCCVSLTLPCVS